MHVYVPPQSLNYTAFFAVLSVVGSIQVSGDGRTFKVSCTSTGGRPLTMSVTGPSGVVEDMMNIVVEGNMEGMGNDTFSANAIIQSGSPGDVYVCKASNGVSNISHHFRLRGLCSKNQETHCNIYLFSCLQPNYTPNSTNFSYISDSGVESAIRRSHSDWICSTLQRCSH